MLILIGACLKIEVIKKVPKDSNTAPAIQHIEAVRLPWIGSQTTNQQVRGGGGIITRREVD